MAHPMAAAKGKLDRLLSKYPFLNEAHHSLHPQVEDAKDAINHSDVSAEDKVDRMYQEIAAEQKSLAAAFRKFSHGASEMKAVHVKNMNEHLGFPSSDDDVQQLIAAIDTDGGGTISFDEFSGYVGKLGGCDALYEVRRKRMGLSASMSFADDKEGLRMALKKAGIDDDAQAYWRLVVPGSEFVEAAKLVDCQQKAVKHIRNLSKVNHEKALPNLQLRVKALGHKDDDLWLTLAWIREMAPIILHLDINKMLQFLEKDDHYRNQFETGSSGGLLKHDVRKKWERDLFGGMYDKATPFERCKYGVLNVMNDYRGVVKCKQYGESYLVLKDARLRCTFSPEDSANLKADKLAVLDFYGHVLNEYSDEELKQTLQVAISKDAALLGDSSKVGNMKYKETQVHGAVCFHDHVLRMVVHTKHRDEGLGDRLKAVCKKFGWSFAWMDEEQDRMRKEEISKLGADAWQERLKRLQESEEAGEIEVQEGYCKQGCGRPVAPGLTSNGRPFKTCCRGCILGFGHDLRCGQIDASKVGEGLCKYGCGREVSKGTDSKGRKRDTCCRGCALGFDHDPNCGKEADGRCKWGCGRPVAEGTTRSGRGYDTCCRECGASKGGGKHSPNCKPA
eukprot:TRINITY_DN28082_c0_g1_i1.p1 TRINITY_DN28082_c0_g1~~TRINITY_DN28082_c0_g1_i1.p1  ORF type:complete len:618 (-),score=133.68 TRINITY_DN28082_c0_g1_i1:115-1968(-)